VAFFVGFETFPEPIPRHIADMPPNFGVKRASGRAGAPAACEGLLSVILEPVAHGSVSGGSKKLMVDPGSEPGGDATPLRVWSLERLSTNGAADPLGPMPRLDRLAVLHRLSRPDQTPRPAVTPSQAAAVFDKARSEVERWLSSRNTALEGRGNRHRQSPIQDGLFFNLLEMPAYFLGGDCRASSGSVASYRDLSHSIVPHGGIASGPVSSLPTQNSPRLSSRRKHSWPAPTSDCAMPRGPCRGTPPTSDLAGPRSKLGPRVAGVTITKDWPSPGPGCGRRCARPARGNLRRDRRKVPSAVPRLGPEVSEKQN
jgi:hypothetical protein